MRIGIFGGSFDPPHRGHHEAVKEAQQTLALDQVLWIPTGTQPWKGEHGASGEERLEMVKALVKGEATWSVLALEVRRGGASYMVDTLDEIVQGLHEWVLLVGADAAEGFPRWKDAQRIQQMVQVHVMPRPSGSISSTLVRERIKAGGDILDLVGPDVYEVIERAGLWERWAR